MIYSDIIKIIYSIIITILISLFCIYQLLSHIRDIFYFKNINSPYIMVIYYIIIIIISLFVLIFNWIFFYYNFLSENKKIHLTYAILTTIIFSVICIFFINNGIYHIDFYYYNKTTIGTISKLICYDVDNKCNNNYDNSIIEYTVDNIKYTNETGLTNVKVGQKFTINYKENSPNLYVLSYSKYRIIGLMSFILGIIILLFLWIFLYKYIQII